MSFPESAISSSSISIEPLTAHIGAVVHGVDARTTVPDDVMREIRAALDAHLVLFFPEQDLTDRQQLAFAAQFGPVNVSSYAGRDDIDLSAARVSHGREEVLDVLDDTADSPPKADLWHTDSAFTPTPPDYAMLNMRHLPPVGGDTLWLSLYAVYDSLSAPMQRFVDELELDLRPPRAERYRDATGIEHISYRPDLSREGTRHPLVRVHPETKRKALFMCGEFMSGIVGLHPAESKAVLDHLRSQLDNPNIQCRWTWRLHDLVVWDERCSNHRATSDHYPHRRTVRRCTMGASTPQGPSGHADA